jgi:Mce-associated membrane protein
MNTTTLTASLYDVLDVEPTASAEEIRAAWRAAVADLDPTDRRFRVYNQAAEVLLDRARRAAYDEEIAAELERGRSDEAEPRRNDRSETEASSLARPHRWLSRLASRTSPQAEADASDAPEPEPEPAAARTAVPGVVRRLAGNGWPVVPGWLLVIVAAVLAVCLVAVGVLLSRPTDTAVAADTQAAQAAAERAIVPVLSYDAHDLDQSAAAAQPYLTSSEKEQYDKLFDVIRQNAPRTGTVVRARYLASGVVRSGTDRVDVLVLVDQVTRNQQHPKVPVVYKNQVTVSMAKAGDQWLVDGLTTNS